MEVLKIMVSGKSVAKLFCMFLAVSAVALFGIMPGARLAAQSTGAVYVLSNQPVENAVIVFHRNADGTLLPGDRKSTRLNSSHRCISYAVFCLKKKKTKKEYTTRTYKI